MHKYAHKMTNVTFYITFIGSVTTFHMFEMIELYISLRAYEIGQLSTIYLSILV